MSEKRKSPVKINFGGKDLFDILLAFKQLNWKRNLNALKGINLNIIMIHGDENSAEFWHIKHGLDALGRPLSSHKDQLIHQQNSVKRICPSDGQEIVISSS